jgi:AsmA protein
MTSKKSRRWPVVLLVVVVLLGAALAIAVRSLDGFLLEKARAAAQEYSVQLERPIQIGDLSVRLFPFVGADVTGIAVGPAAGEAVPPAQVERVSVRVKLWPLMTSMGKKIDIRSVEIASPALNVVRGKDGKTNLERLMERLEASKEKEPPPSEKPSGETPEVRVERAELTSGKIVLTDESVSPPKALTISDIGLEASGFEVGRPLEVLLTAAVQNPKPNVRVELKTKPVPASMKPMPERIRLKVEPLDMRPLMAFVPGDSKMTGGTFEADWTAELGAAVPGGEGPTSLSGVVKATGMRFAEAASDLNALLETQVKGDFQQGQLSVDKLLVEVGPARIEGGGKVSDFNGENPRFEGLALESKNLDLAQLAERFPPLRPVAAKVAGPIHLSIRGSGSQESQAISLDADFKDVKLQVPNQISKAAGAPMRLSAQLRGKGAQEKGLGFSIRGDLSGADLRPGGTWAKAPGQKLSLDAEGAATLGGAGKSGTTTVKLSKLNVQMMQDAIAGAGQLTSAGDKTSFDFKLNSDRLNVDELMLPDPPQKSDKEGKGKTPSKPKEASSLRGVSGKVVADIGTLKAKGVVLSRAHIEGRLQDEVFTLDKFTANAYGGTLALSGTEVKLTPERPFDVKVSARNVDLGEALARGGKKVLAGRFNGDVTMSGLTHSPMGLVPSLTGDLDGKLFDARFLSKDVLGSLTQLLGKALPQSTAQRLTGGTDLGKELDIGLSIQKGMAKLKAPLNIKQPDASLSVDGGIKLTGDLALNGMANLSPELISRLTGGKAKVTQALPLKFELKGPASNPQIGGVDVKGATQGLVKQAVEEKKEQVEKAAEKELQRAGDKAGDKAKQKLRSLFGK